MATTQQSSTKQDILQYLLKHSQATAGQLSEILEVSPQAIRKHLKDLETDDMVVYSVPENSGMGRPQHIYHLSPGGKEYLQRSATKVSGGYGEFAVSLLDTLAETVGREQVKTILQKQWERKAQEYQEKVGQGCLEERVATLVELRKAEGFMAEFRPVEEKDDGYEGNHGFLFMEHTCAISNVAESFPSVCGHELEMFAAILPDCSVQRTHWLIDGQHRCVYLIKKN